MSMDMLWTYIDPDRGLGNRCLDLWYLATAHPHDQRFRGMCSCKVDQWNVQFVDTRAYLSIQYDVLLCECPCGIHCRTFLPTRTVWAVGVFASVAQHVNVPVSGTNFVWEDTARSGRRPCGLHPPCPPSLQSSPVEETEPTTPQRTTVAPCPGRRADQNHSINRWLESKYAYGPCCAKVGQYLDPGDISVSQYRW